MKILTFSLFGTIKSKFVFGLKGFGYAWLIENSDGCVFDSNERGAT